MTRSPLRPWTYFPLGLQAYRDTFRFTGRSRRLEIAEFYILAMLIRLALELVAVLVGYTFEITLGSPAESYLATRVAVEGFEFILALPMFGLMVRRIQDFGLPGWAFLPLMIYAAVISTWKSLAIITVNNPPAIWKSVAFLAPNEMPSTGLQIFHFVIVAGLLVSWCIPGTEGPNRYGPDPRLDPEPAPAA